MERDFPVLNSRGENIGEAYNELQAAGIFEYWFFETLEEDALEEFEEFTADMVFDRAAWRCLNA